MLEAVLGQTRGANAGLIPTLLEAVVDAVADTYMHHIVLNLCLFKF